MKIARIESEVGELLELSDDSKVWTQEGGQSPAVKPSQDREPPAQTAGQDGPPEVTHSGGPGP